MNPADIDLSKLDSTGLNTLQSLIRAEVERREYVANAETIIATINRASLALEKLADGSEWRRPAGAKDGYPQGFSVTRNGKSWISLVNANVWAPGEAKWRQVVAEGETADFVQPSGLTDSYNRGDQITYDNKIFMSTINANVWSPKDRPSAWVMIEDLAPPQPVEAPESNEPTTDTQEPVQEPTEPVQSFPQWFQPDDSSPYDFGDRVTYEGTNYESLETNNTAIPTDTTWWKVI